MNDKTTENRNKHCGGKSELIGLVMCDSLANKLSEAVMQWLADNTWELEFDHEASAKDDIKAVILEAISDNRGLTASTEVINEKLSTYTDKNCLNCYVQVRPDGRVHFDDKFEINHLRDILKILQGLDT